MKLTNKIADYTVDSIDTLEEAAQMLRPILKKRNLRFGKIYYILGIQIIVYDKQHRKPHYPQYR
jgi:hypothetical protein